MKVINILGAFIVLLANLTVSFSHTLALFRSGGFTGGLEYIAALGVETTFIMGFLNIVVSRLRGVSPGTPAILGGLLGVLLVSWSNVSAGWEYGPTGILLGLATPASLIVAEAILSRAILQRRAADHNRVATAEMGEVVDQPATQVADSATESTNQDERPASHEWPTSRVGELDDRVVGQSDKSANRIDERPADQAAESPVDQPDEKAVDQGGRTANVVEMAEWSAKRSTNQVNGRSTSSEAAGQSSGRLADQPTGQPSGRDGRPANRSTTRPASKSTNKSADQPLDKVVEVAERYCREHGQPPSQRKLAEMAGCSRHKAIKALEALDIKRQTG